MLPGTKQRNVIGTLVSFCSNLLYFEGDKSEVMVIPRFLHWYDAVALCHFDVVLPIVLELAYLSMLHLLTETLSCHSSAHRVIKSRAHCSLVASSELTISK